MADIYAYIEQYIHLPKLRLTTYDRVGYTRKEISEIAKSVRRDWGLGDGPISNLTLLLENNGILVSKVGLDAKKADACSVFFTAPGTAKRPMIFLTSGTSAVRSRRDLAHELGHQVLHSWMDKEQFEEHQDIIEEEAETFASYFSHARAGDAARKLCRKESRCAPFDESALGGIGAIHPLSSGGERLYHRGYRNTAEDSSISERMADKRAGR